MTPAAASILLSYAKNDVASLIQETPDKLKFKKLYNVSWNNKIAEVYEDYLLKETKAQPNWKWHVNCVWIKDF